MTKAARWAGLLIGLIFGVVSLAQAPAPANSAGVVVADVTGTVRYRIGDSEPQAVVKGQTIPIGARIATGTKSTVVLTFPDGQIVAMGTASRIIFREFNYLPNAIAQSKVTLNLTDGSVQIVMGAIGQHDPGLIQIQVGTKTTAQTPHVPRGGDLGLVMLGSATLVQVNQGKVALRVAGQSYGMATGQGAVVQADGAVQLGSIAQLEAQPGRTSDDKEMFAHFRETQQLKFPHSPRQTMITLSTPPYDEKRDPDLIAAALDALPPTAGIESPPANSTSTTPSTGGGGGGIPCAASCN